jgi:hypothetical protein
MFVALWKRVMLLSELIIIYLAVAAPFGVAHFLRQRAGARRTRSLLHATCAALLWPLALFSRSFVQKRFRREESETDAPEASLSREQRTDAARRALLSSLYRIEDTAAAIPGASTVATRGAVRETIAAVERYVGLAAAVADADAAAASHAPRETELCRISGRTGDDLHLAALCHGRRNIARLHAHQADSRLELLHALAELREVFESTLAATPASTDAHGAARPLLAALPEAYARAFELLSLFADERAAARVARLLEAARAQARRIESLASQAAPQSLLQTDQTGNVNGDEPCTTSIPHTNSQTQLSRTQTLRAHG